MIIDGSTVTPVPLSSLINKLIIASTGLGLAAYLVVHLAGNLVVFAGRRAFNEYSHVLVSNPLIVPIEIGLVGIFVIHVYQTVTTWWRSRQARPVPYVERRWAGPPSRKSWASTTMIATGLVALAFVILHVATFRYGPYYTVDGGNVRDLYRLELEVFQNPYWVGFYVVGLTLIGFHTWHGIASAFESMGLHHPHYTPRLILATRWLVVLVMGGFILIPLVVYFGGI